MQKYIHTTMQTTHVHKPHKRIPYLSMPHVNAQLPIQLTRKKNSNFTIAIAIMNHWQLAQLSVLLSQSEVTLESYATSTQTAALKLSVPGWYMLEHAHFNARRRKVRTTPHSMLLCPQVRLICGV